MENIKLLREMVDRLENTMGFKPKHVNLLLTAIRARIDVIEAKLKAENEE